MHLHQDESHTYGANLLNSYLGSPGWWIEGHRSLEIQIEVISYNAPVSKVETEYCGHTAAVQRKVPERVHLSDNGLDCLTGNEKSEE